MTVHRLIPEDHDVEPLEESLRVVEPVHADTDDEAVARQPELTSETLLFRRQRGVGRDPVDPVVVDADGRRHDVGGVAVQPDDAAVHLGGQLVAHAEQEVAAVAIELEGQQVVGEQAAEDGVPPGAHAQAVRVRPRDMPEQGGPSLWLEAPQIRRDDVQRRVVIQSNVEGRDMGGLVAELQQRIAKEVDLPPGYTVVYGGQFENQQRAQKRLMIVVPLSLGLIFLLLYFAFNSVGQALLIMLNVPLALIGGIAALYFSGQYLSVPGSIGFIALFGVAVLNGVVMVNSINQRLAGGLPAQEAVFEGALSRLRPVLMTASIAALGLIPMLLASGVGSEVQRPLATVVVGGLASSTLLTLFVLPVLYQLFSRAGQRQQ